MKLCSMNTQTLLKQQILAHSRKASAQLAGYDRVMQTKGTEGGFTNLPSSRATAGPFHNPDRASNQPQDYCSK